MFTNQKVLLTATPNGSVFGTISWSTDRPDVLHLAASPDGLTCEAVALGVVGDANVTAMEEARPDGQTQAVSKPFPISVEPLPHATEIVITAGEPEDAAGPPR